MAILPRCTDAQTCDPLVINQQFTKVDEQEAHGQHSLSENRFLASNKCCQCIFATKFPCKRLWPSISTNLNLLHQRMFRTKFGWKPRSYGEDDFKMLSMYFCYYLPLEKACGPSFDHTWISFTQRYFVPMLIKLLKRLWRRFLNIVDASLLFCGYLPFEKDIALYLNKPEFPLQRKFSAKFS